MSTESGTPTPSSKKATGVVPPVTDTDPGHDAGDGEGTTGESSTAKMSPEDAARMIADLRRENAKHRMTNKTLKETLSGLEAKYGSVKKAVNGEDPEDDKANLAATARAAEALSVENAILKSAIENKIPADKLDYYKYLIEQKAGELEEGEELDVSPIVESVMKIGQSQGVKATSGVTPPKTGGASDGEEVTVDAFRKMGFIEKSQLQRRDPALYSRLAQASL